jgi:hypothetical protein
VEDVVALAVVLAVIGVALLAWAVAAVLGATPSRGTPFGASVVEAGERTQDLVAEFWDWLRLGR